MNKKEFYSVEDVCIKTGLVKATVYRLIHDGKLPCLKIGRQYFIPADVLKPSVIDIFKLVYTQ